MFLERSSCIQYRKLIYTSSSPFADVKKMPLGKLSKTQIAKGFECLEELEEAIEKKKPKKTLQELSSRFYTLIPHDFGRRIPPVMDSIELIQEKYDMLSVRMSI